jgi:hypothetical protein
MKRSYKMTSMFVLVAILLCFMFNGIVNAEENIVKNPGFEEPIFSDTTEGQDQRLTWTPKDFSWAKIERVTEEKHSGDYSLKVYDRAYWWATAYQLYYTFKGKETITCSVWVKIGEGGGERLVRFGVFDKNGNDMPTIIGSPIEVLANDKEWTLLSGTFRPAKDMEEAYIGIYYQPASSEDEDQMNWDGVFYIDDVSITGSTGFTLAGTLPEETPEEPIEETPEQPTEEPVETPSEEPTETPSEDPTEEQPVEQPTEEEPTTEPTEQPIEEQPTDEPGEEAGSDDNGDSTVQDNDDVSDQDGQPAQEVSNEGESDTPNSVSKYLVMLVILVAIAVCIGVYFVLKNKKA